MDLSIILTYRCNAMCSMCNVWRNPSSPKEEINLETMEKIPHGFDYLNLTGGEPTLRQDLVDIVDLLYPRAMKLEISSNGLLPQRLEAIVKKYPCVKIRFSLEGIGRTNNIIRGEKNGFSTKLQGLLRLKELGGTDLGFAVTIQDENASQLVELFKFARHYGFELATSTLHNGFQFHKSDNILYDRLQVARCIEDLVVEQLRTNNVKTWFRAYLNLGLVAKVLGQDRILPCTAATDFAFVDPWGDVFACNVRPDLKLGNLEKQTWEEIYPGPATAVITQQVQACEHNCWMVGSAKTAMRSRRNAKIPKLQPLLWVIENKARATLGMPVGSDTHFDPSLAYQDKGAARRVSYLGQSVKRRIEKKDENHYAEMHGFINK